MAAAIAAGVLIAGIHVPLVEDALFWWVPKGLWMAQHGPALSASGDLPTLVETALRGHDGVVQWAGGLPDYDHPPLWYWWLGLFLSKSPSVQAAHLACLLPAVLAAVGFVALAERLDRPWAGLAPLCLPPVIAQILRPELDLPLLAVVPWALVALLDRRWWTFAGLGLLAPWLKEPGVLLVFPALLAVVMTQRQRAFAARAASALTPLLGLLAWRLVHGRLADPERLANDLGQYLHDLSVVAQLALWHQGRWALLLGGLALLWRLKQHPRRIGPTALVGAFALTWLAFFAAVGFFATRDAEQSLTHVRYFLPGLCALAVLLSAAAPPVATLGLLYLFARSPFGPEASLFGEQAALAERDAAPFIQQSLDQGRTVWVGSYQAAALLQPWAGITQDPPPPQTATGGRLRIYAEATAPSSIHSDDIVLAAAYGEPTGALERALELSTLKSWTRGDARVTAWLVQGASRPPHTTPPSAPRPR